jgi:3-hydroxyacyl-[acyl-carrier-protein] dehydratase
MNGAGTDICGFGVAAGLIRLEPTRHGVAVLGVPGTLSLFDSHFPRFPVLPGVLLLDCMAALAALVLGDAAAGAPRWRLSQVEALRFRHFVQPGDRAEIAVRVLESTADTARCAATVTVERRTVATARALRLRRLPAGADAPGPAPVAAAPPARVARAGVPA